MCTYKRLCDEDHCFFGMRHHVFWYISDNASGELKSVLASSPVPMRGRGSWYKFSVPGGPEGGPRPVSVAYVFVFIGGIIICRF
jgi:hypothetical protein